MTKDEVLTHFETNFASLKQMILNVAVWSIEPDRDLCQPLAEGLKILANAGNKKAAVLYAAIAVYDNNADCFSKETASQLLITQNAIDEYVSFIDEEFREVVDEDAYDWMFSFPAVSFLNEISKEVLNLQ